MSIEANGKMNTTRLKLLSLTDFLLFKYILSHIDIDVYAN
jgi:hypothetical protein